MSDERTSPGTLAYEPPDPRRRLSRRLARVALIASAIALLLVARGLFAKFAPALRYHIERYAAQREVLGLATPGVGFDAEGGHRTRRPAAGDTLDRVAIRWQRSWLPTPLFIISRDNDPGPTGPSGPNDIIYLGPLVDRHGEERLLLLRIASNAATEFPLTQSFPDEVLVPPSTRPAMPEHFPVTWFATVRPLRAFWEDDADPLCATSLNDLFASAAKLHFDPPVLDPNDRRRLLLNGTADDVPFAFEFSLDVKDRVQCFDLMTSHATTFPSE